MSRASRRWFWSGVVLALALTAGGTGAATAGMLTAGKVETTVHEYFDAVAEGRAADALALGAVPAGERSYLTDEVLAAQLKVANIDDVSIGAITRSDTEATVDVRYRLVGPDMRETVRDTLRLEKDGWRWRLAQVATPIAFAVPRATGRVALAGTALPTDSVLMFPGALPLTTNSPLLSIDRSRAVAAFDGPDTITIQLQVPDPAKASIADALDAAITACLQDSSEDPSCPTTVTGVRFVPGSMTGTAISLPSAVGFLCDVLPDPSGRITVSGTFDAQAQWLELNFNNLAVQHSGQLTLPYTATIPAVEPLRVQWGAES